MREYAAEYATGLNRQEIFYQFDDDEMILRFEQEFAEYLQGCERDDWGGVIAYLRGDNEVAFFDYNNMLGSIYELGNKHRHEFTWEWAERVGA